jgi:hypothetical protein
MEGVREGACVSVGRGSKGKGEEGDGKGCEENMRPSFPTISNFNNVL